MDIDTNWGSLPSPRRSRHRPIQESGMDGLLNSLKVIIASTAILIPSSIPYRGVIIEGCYSLMNVIAVFKNATWKEISPQQSSLISQIEVFLEGIAMHFYDRSTKQTLIVLIELLKSVCRLAQFVGSDRSSMMIQWFKGEQNQDNLSVQSYCTFHLRWSMRVLRSSSVCVSRRSAETDNNAHIHVGLGLLYQEGSSSDANTFVGSRSGITILYPSSLAAGTTKDSDLSPNHNNNSNSNNNKEEDEEGLNRNDDVQDRIAKDRDVLLLGEVVYILRPLVHSVLVLYVDHNNNDNHDDEDEDDNEEIDNDNDRFSLMTRMVGKDLLFRSLSLLVSVALEMSSLHLTGQALQKLRLRSQEEAVEEVYRSENVPKRDLRLVLQHMGMNGITSTIRHRHAFDAELNRRRNALYFYLIRSPLFDRTTLPLLKSLSSLLKNVPLLGSLPDYLLGILVYLNKFHFYNSNSS